MPRIMAELPPTTTPQLQRQAVPRINAEPATPAYSPHTPQSTNLQPTTPSKRRRQRVESDDDYEPETPSPAKRVKTPRGAPLTPSRTPARPPPQTPSSVPPTPSTALTTPSSAARTPSQRALRAAKRKQEKEWKFDWTAVVADKHFSHPDPQDRRISAKVAMEQYPVTRGELDMLPCQLRRNPYNRSYPIRWYKIESVRQTACLKHAMLAGLHKDGLSRAELVSRGEELWKAVQCKRDQRRKQRHDQRRADRSYQIDEYYVSYYEP